MRTSNSWLRGSWLAALLLALLVSCSFNPERAPDICAEIEALPTTELTAQGRRIVMETPGTIQVSHGFGTAELGSGDYLKVEERADIPGYANRATVILNGWRVSYEGDDQHVRAFGTMIGKIRPEGRQLVWNAVGLLRDNDAHEAYEWTYRYTVIAWNDAALNVFVNHDDVDRFCNADSLGSDNFYFAWNAGTTTSLSAFSSFIESPEFPRVGTVAVLPRGFGFVWGGDDHHMLQAGYNLDHGSSLTEAEKKYHKAAGEENPLSSTASIADSRFVTWDTQSILKDNDWRRGYMFGEMVSACGGRDVGVIQPPFAILPIEDNSGITQPCIVEEGATESHHVVVQGLGFEYAIPMLTGWELGYGKAVRGCDDEHVKEMGIWIEDWNYVRNPASLEGTLDYTISSVLRDDDSDPGRFHREKVSILVFRPLAPGVAPIKRLPDLIPFSPAGTQAEDFCRLEENRKLLRVSIRNLGPGDAGPSKTSVDFGSVRSAQNTPAIPAGGVVDLLFKVPATCFDPYCEFRIIVDSGHQVDETNEGNNATSGTCAG